MDKEFRGVWVASVDNIDWPPKPGLPVEEQKAALRADFDLFAKTGLNAVIFQVRPACDAFFDSAFEPWSEFISGTQGIHPGYDPLQFAIEEAHARGLELHAWLNPFRARAATRLSPPAPNHISLIHPYIVKEYGPFQWLDPGFPLTHEYTLNVVREVLHHYAVDGVHIDDYFYPYKIAGQPFPDNDSWALYQGPLSRDDWRRDNVNRFVEALWKVCKAERPDTKFGISPFGIWRPGHPPTVVGLDQFAELYADARLWLQSGWVDYFTPQLYWKIDSPGQSFPKLLTWWQDKEQNPATLPIWPGLFTSRIFDKTPWPAEEIVNQIKIARQQGANGHIHFSAKAIRNPQMQAALSAIYA